MRRSGIRVPPLAPEMDDFTSSLFATPKGTAKQKVTDARLDEDGPSVPIPPPSVEEEARVRALTITGLTIPEGIGALMPGPELSLVF